MSTDRTAYCPSRPADSASQTELVVPLARTPSPAGVLVRTADTGTRSASWLLAVEISIETNCPGLNRPSRLATIASTMPVRAVGSTAGVREVTDATSGELEPAWLR